MWCETSPRRVAVNWTPLDSGELLGARIAQRGGAWIFTSATLAVGEDFGHFLARIGLPESMRDVLPSPFDYARNARLLSAARTAATGRGRVRRCAAAWPCGRCSRPRAGGAFLLFTSYRASEPSAERWLRERGRPGPLLVQGSAPRTSVARAVSRERRGDCCSAPAASGRASTCAARRCGSSSSTVCRSPRPAIRSTQARIESIRRRRGDPFREFQLPQAVLALKQGVGRLIRDFDGSGRRRARRPASESARLRPRVSWPVCRRCRSSMRGRRRCDFLSPARAVGARRVEGAAL